VTIISGKAIRATRRVIFERLVMVIRDYLPE